MSALAVLRGRDLNTANTSTLYDLNNYSQWSIHPYEEFRSEYCMGTYEKRISLAW